MRINVYAEELSGQKPRIVSDNTNDGEFTGVRFDIGQQTSFGKGGNPRSEHGVTLWGKGDGRDLIPLLEGAIDQLKTGKAAPEGAGQQRQPAHA
jgi:hypothetical protein